MSGQRGDSGDERLLTAVGRRLWGDRSPLRHALRWLFGDREHVEQEGLLAERTLLVRPPPPPGEADDEPGAGPERRSPDPRA
jgi:hypothetical protein